MQAMLEAFVHDPLINWRLLNATEAATEAALARDTDGTAAAAAGGAGGAAGAGAPGGGVILASAQPVSC
jgi:FKBP12-rapamycin complex-associated protein